MRTSAEFLCSAFAYHSVLDVAFAAERLGYAKDAGFFTDEAVKIRSAVNDVFYHGGGRYDKNGSPTAQATALELGIVPPEEIEAVRKRLVESVHEMDDKIDFGIVGSRTIFRQLCEAGAVDLAWRLIMRPGYPSYVDMVSLSGGGTLMESFDGDMSRNHIMFGDVGAWAYEYLAGLQIGKGQARSGLPVTIRPFVPSALNRVKASVESAEGRVAVEWTKKNGRFELVLDIPDRVSATVVMPDGKIYQAHERRQKWHCRLPK
jgi:alpha-L-rhamnosidase